MRPIVIAANWKMNTTPADAGELARTIAGRTRVPGVTRVICPPFVCLAAVRDALAGEDVAVGAQNVHHELAGAYTGEISAPMLDGLATWVILGHSERRRDAGETDALIAAKLGRALAAGLRPILCVGRDARGPRARRRGGRGARRPGSSRGALEPQRRRRAGGRHPRDRVRAGLGDRDRPERERSGRGRDVRGDPGRAVRHRRARIGPGHARPLRRQRDRGEHRRVPDRARDRRGARRRSLAQARRDGRDRRPCRRHRGRPRWPRPREPAPPDRPRRHRRLRHRPRSGCRRDRVRGPARLARPARALAAHAPSGRPRTPSACRPGRWATRRSVT